MLKKFILTAAALAGLSSSLMAQAQFQPCTTDAVNQMYRDKYPQIAQREAALEAEIERQLAGMNLSQFYKTTGLRSDTEVLHVPVVFHIIHNYGNEYVSDDSVYKTVREINEIFMKRNADTSDIIPTYKNNVPGTNVKYAGRANIMFHLAQRDPQGRPTNGITRERSYLTVGGGDNAKLGGWAPDSYVNIWVVNAFVAGSPAAAYALKPAAGDVIPFYDGVNIAYTANGGFLNLDNTTAHELGHVMNLDHPFGQVNGVNMGCGDDNVDDTPPTNGGDPQGGCSDLPEIYDTTCTQIQNTIGKFAPDPTDTFPDRVANRGVTFLTRSRVHLRSVDIYPHDTANAPFSIVLRRNGNIVSTYNGTVTAGNGAVQTVPVNFIITADSAYTLTFGVNPNARRDSLQGGFSQTVAGAIRILTASTNSLYNYFYNWRVQTGYFKIYTGAQMLELYDDSSMAKVDGAYLIDYPDTVNAQNVMDYTYCSKMFTNGQGVRMRAALRSNIGRRSSLISQQNQVNTGIRVGNAFPARAETLPVAAFSVDNYAVAATEKVYVCPGTTVTFRNRSWGDTISTANWSFSNGGTSSTALAAAATSFTTPGYVTVTLMVKGNGVAGNMDTIVNPQAVYVADVNNKINPVGYYQEFNAGGDLDRYPIFNYYNNVHRWELSNTGFFDNTSIRYHTYDPRQQGTVASAIGSPAGDYDDFFMPPFDLSTLSSGDCNFNFMYAGASRTSNINDMNDVLEIAYSTTCGNNWNVLKTITKGELNNNGIRTTDWQPNGGYGSSEWSLASIPVPVAVRTNNVLFRVRYRPGIVGNRMSFLGTGNNFYMDRINISNFPTGVDGVAVKELGVTLSPNPTQGGATVVLKGTDAGKLTVTDVTGKVVYRADAGTQGAGFTRFEIPAASVAVKGIYIVQVSQGAQKHTEKLVVY